MIDWIHLFITLVIQIKLLKSYIFLKIVIFMIIYEILRWSKILLIIKWTVNQFTELSFIFFKYSGKGNYKASKNYKSGNSFDPIFESENYTWTAWLSSISQLKN